MRGTWRSPLRGPWLTSVFGFVLLLSLPIVTVTGLVSYSAYGPALGQALPHDVGWLQLPAFDWPTAPVWLYQATQGVHIVVGLAVIPVVLAKLWSVIPRVFTWPPVRSLTHALERLSLLMLVGGILFEIITGVLNIQYDYVFGFSFYTAHYFGAWVFIAGFAAHIVVKIPLMVSALRSRSLRGELRTSTAETCPETGDDSLVPDYPGPATMSRRGAVALVGSGSALLVALSAGQTVGGPLRASSFLLPRGRGSGHGPNGFHVNRTAAAAGVDGVDDSWRLALGSPRGARTLSLDQLQAMPQHTAVLPIACVEGWSTTQEWTGVRLRELAALVDTPEPSSARVDSLETAGTFNTAQLQSNQIRHPDALLALAVNGAQLSLDHGFPARIIVPAIPGVHNTKWVSSIEFGA